MDTFTLDEFSYLFEKNRKLNIIPIVAKTKSEHLDASICINLIVVFKKYFSLPRKLEKYQSNINFINSCFHEDSYDPIFIGLWKEEVWKQWIEFLNFIKKDLNKKSKRKNKFSKKILYNYEKENILEFLSYYLEKVKI